MNTIIKLDYTLENPEERKALVEQIIAENDSLSPAYLEILADYLVLCMEKQEKKEKKLLTENRLSTIGKRETSYEGLAASLESGEDGIYQLTSENNKNAIFKPKISITRQDLAEMPELAQLRQEITKWDAALKRSSGKSAYIIKKSLIEMRKDQYLIKQSYQVPVTTTKICHSGKAIIHFDDDSFIDPRTHQIVIKGFSLMNPLFCSLLLNNYSHLKQDSWDNFLSDTWYLLQELEELVDEALANYPMYMDILIHKIDGDSNKTIQEYLNSTFDSTYSVEYISKIWRQKIPKLISQCAQKRFLIAQYVPLKKCSKCGQFKPAYISFFSKNSTSKDGLYSICKECRNKKKK